MLAATLVAALVMLGVRSGSTPSKHSSLEARSIPPSMPAEQGSGGVKIVVEDASTPSPAGDPFMERKPREVAITTEALSKPTASHLAFSVEEARWLSANGYPSAWELEHLNLLDWEAVRAAAFRGDEVAQNLLAERLVSEGRIEEAAAMFGNPRGMDSIYALLRSAELEASLSRYPRPEDNYRLFMLYAEYARLMGDHQVDRVIDRVLPPNVDRQALQREALRSLPDFARSQFDLAARTQLPPPRPSTRPNLDRWQEAASGTAPIITVEVPSPYAVRPWRP